MNTNRAAKFACLLAIAAIIVGLSACDQLVSILTPGDAPDVSALPEGLPDDLAMYRLWTHVEIGPPSPHGAAHGQGDRTTYINPPGVETLKDMDAETFPNGTVLVKDIMDDTNTFLWRVAVMWKLEDMDYADHAGWKYVQYQRDGEYDEFVAAAGDGTTRGSNGCHQCHSAVLNPAVPGRDYVFVELPGYETADGDDVDHHDDDTDDHDADNSHE